MKKQKRILSLTLAVVMALALLPTTASAAGVTVTEVVPCKYELITNFSEGTAMVQDGNYNYGFIDTTTGKEIVPCKYPMVDFFHGGYAMVYTFSRRQGIVDTTGKEVVPCKYKSISIDWYEGGGSFFAAENENGQCGLIDAADRVIVPFQYGGIVPLGEGLWCGVYENGPCDIIDPVNKRVIHTQYDGVEWWFSEGFAVVRKGSSTEARYGFIDATGKEITPIEYVCAYDFSEGFARVGQRIGEGRNSKNVYGFIDTTGKEITPLEYDDVYDFSEGFARVKKDGKTYFINTTGKAAFPFEYDFAGDFSGGFAEVSLNKKYGLIDTTGKEVVPCKYDRIWGRTPNLAGVKLGDKYGLVDITTGKEIVPCEYDDVSVSAKSKNVAWLELNGKYGLIDITGKEIVPFRYSDAKFLSDGLFAVKNENDRWGVINAAGREIVPFRYTWISDLAEGLLLVADENDREGILDTAGNQIVPCKYSYCSTENMPDGLIKVYGSGGYGLLAYTMPAPVIKTAKENLQTVQVDGKDVSFAMYSPDNGGTNYVRLVDLAVALKGTAGQFNVGYDGKVLLTTGVAYMGAAAAAPFHSAMEYTMLDEPTYVNGVAKNLEGIRFEYQNGGYTYYKLRDLGEALGFNVGWDNATQRIYIESDKAYDPNN